MNYTILTSKYVGEYLIEFVDVGGTYEVIETCKFGNKIIHVIKLYCDALNKYENYKIY